jgi:hypothetical protein
VIPLADKAAITPNQQDEQLVSNISDVPSAQPEKIVQNETDDKVEQTNQSETQAGISETILGALTTEKSMKRKLMPLAYVMLALIVGGGGYLGIAAYNNISHASNSPQDKLAEMGIRYTADEFVKYAGQGNEEVANLFLEAEMPVDAYRKSDGFTPLMAAASFGRVEMVNLLLEQGAKVAARDKDEQTALMKAVSYNQPEIVKILLRAGADYNVHDLRGNTVVSLAVEKKDPQVLQALTQAGAKGLEEALAQLREKNKTDKKTPGDKAAATSAAQAKVPETAAPPAGLLLSAGKAGYMQVGKSVESLYQYYDKTTVVQGVDYSEGRPYPVVKVYTDGRDKPSMVGSVRISNQGQQQTIDGIHIYDERFKTDKGIGLNSTLGDLRRAGAFTSIKHADESLYAVGKGMTFELNITLNDLPTEWLQNGDPNSLPDSMTIKSIVLQ